MVSIPLYTGSNIAGNVSRPVLTAAGAHGVGIVGICGCLSDSHQLLVGVGPPESRSQQPATRWRSRSTATASGSRSKQRIESQSQRLYAADGEITAAGVDNTTRDRASNPRGVSDRDPIENRAHQGFAYGQRDRYWLAVDQPGESLPAGTEAFEQRVVYPGSARDDRVVCSSTPTANRRRREPTAIDRRQ